MGWDYVICVSNEVVICIDDGVKRGAGIDRDINSRVRKIVGRGIGSGVGSDVGDKFESGDDGEVGFIEARHGWR